MKRPLFPLILLRVVIGLLLLAAGPTASAQIEITAVETTGALEWTNSQPNLSELTVEWTASLTSGIWRSSWDGLAAIPATASTYRVDIPMAYRVIARTNVLRSQWTVLFYWMADNELEPDFVTKFLDLAQWTSDTNVQLVVQFARNGQDARHGNWHGCERFVLTHGMVPTQDNAVADWGDGQGGRLVNMADPATLADFLDWAQLRHPAGRTALFIGNHGFGWTGFGISWSYAKSFMYVPDLARVLREARAPVDCLFFDACLMNMAEVVTELGDSRASHLLASETYGQTDWPYGWLLEGLQASPGWSPLEFVSDVNERLWTYYSVSNVVPGITLCTSDLSLAPAFASNTARFVAGVLDTNIPIGEVRTRATDVMASIDNLLIVRRMGSDWNDIAHGLAVYFPLKDGLATPPSFSEYTFRRTRFAFDAGWRDLLDAYYDPMSHPPFHGELISVRAAVTNYLDYGSDEHIDLTEFLRGFLGSDPI